MLFFLRKKAKRKKIIINILGGLVNPSEEKDGAYDGAMLSSQPNIWIILNRYNYIAEKGEFWSSGTGSGKGQPTRACVLWFEQVIIEFGQVIVLLER